MGRPTKQQQLERQLALATAPIQKALSPLDTPDKFKLGSMGSSGVNIFNGVSVEETSRDLNWPTSARTFKEMSMHTSVNACLTLYDNLISKVVWRVVAPERATEEEQKQAEFISQCLHDMDTSFRQVIRDSLTSNVYGFAVQEKVYRRRYKSNGSMYDDGKIALKKIALRNQETIEKFVMDDSNSEVLGVKQNLNLVNGSNYISNKAGTVVIPRSKFMHVTTGRNRGNPFGISPLRDAYLAWRYLTVIQEIEAAGISKDLTGIPLLEIPPQYMSADATPEQKAIYEEFKNMIRNVQVGAQAGIILPSSADPETRTKMFDFRLVSNEGGKKNFDIDKVKSYYQSQIYVALCADVLQLGNTGVGSFSLGVLKNTLTGAAIESMLDNIVETFNREVIRQLYDLNGFDVSRACRLDYEGLHSSDLDTLSKFIQRTASVGLLEKDRDMLNSIRKAMGLDAKPEDEPVDESVLTGNSSKAGEQLGNPLDGSRTTAGDGTDASVSNLENS